MKKLSSTTYSNCKGEAVFIDHFYTLSPVLSQTLANHSPTGFSWGYGGSGPAQLALAILLDYLGDKRMAPQFYQDFKWKVIAHLPQNGPWQITGSEIDAVLGEIAKGVSA